MLLRLYDNVDSIMPVCFDTHTQDTSSFVLLPLMPYVFSIRSLAYTGTGMRSLERLACRLRVTPG